MTPNHKKLRCIYREEELRLLRRGGRTTTTSVTLETGRPPKYRQPSDRVDQ